MTPETAAASAERGKMSEFSRMTGVLFDPKAAFADIAARPRWLPPLIAMVLMSVVYMALFTQRVGWESTVRQQIESSSRTQNMTADQRERAITQGAKVASIIGYAGPVVGIPLFSLAMAGVLLGAFKVMTSAEVNFRQSFAICCYSHMVGVITAALSIVVLFLKRPEEFNLQNPLAFNIGAFLDPSATAKWQYTLASSLDLFSIWTVLVLASGFAATGRKLSFGGSVTVVASLWVVVILIKAGWTALFS